MKRHTKITLIFVTMILTVLFLTGCKTKEKVKSQEQPANHGNKVEKPPSFLLVTIDTWRSDYIGVSGAGRVKTPNMDRLAGDGVYDKKIAVECPLTTPSHATIMTGLLPLNHGILDCSRYKLESGLRTIAGTFGKAGYDTAAFVSGESLKSRFGLDRGFDLYDEGGMGKRTRGDWTAASRRGEETTNAVIDYMKGVNKTKSLFLWVHYYDAHLPYRHRVKYDDQYPRDAYAAQVAFIDSQIGILVNLLRSDPNRNWRIIITGDHGEGLGDHGEATHGYALYASTTEVPLIIYPKPAKSLLHSKPWALMDLASTVLNWFNLPALPNSDGENLFLAGKKDRVLPMLTLSPSFTFGVLPCVGIRQDSLVFLQQGSHEELYDLKKDPEELHNLIEAAEHGYELKRLREVCNRTLPTSTITSRVRPSLNSTPEELDNLRGLGYISGPSRLSMSLKDVPTGGVLEDYDSLERIRERAYKTGNRVPLMKLYSKLLERYPGSASFCKNYGVLLLRAGDKKKALPVLERAVQLDPGDVGNLVNLAGLYLGVGKAKDAQVLLESALKINDKVPEVYFGLAILNANVIGDSQRAVFYFRKYLELKPNAPDAKKVRRYITSHENETQK